MRKVRRRWPPVARSNGTANEKVAAEEIDGFRPTGRQIVLQRLKEGGWVAGEELVELAGSEALRRVRELRAAGHIIEARPSGGGPWEYHYGGKKVKCLPCAMDRHDECDVDTGRSVYPTPCSCSEEHVEEDPRPVRRRVVRRRVRPQG